MERQKFEDKLKEVFAAGELNPTENVWNNIELDLARTESHQMRRRLVFYKMVAAASVFFALSVVGMSLYLVNRDSSAGSNNVAAVNQNETPLVVDERKPASALNEKTDDQMTATEKQIRSGNNGQSGQNGNLQGADVRMHSLGTARNEGDVTAISLGKDFAGYADLNTITPLKHNPLVRIQARQKVNFAIPDVEPKQDPVAVMLARLEQREMDIRRDDEKEEKQTSEGENLWTSLGFSAGPFNSVSESNIPAPMSRSTVATAYQSSDDVADNEARASGIAYSMGVNVGTRISERWVLQGGVNYLMQSSDYTAHSAVSSADFESFRPASINELGKLSNTDALAETKVVTTAPYNVNNNVAYLSVPIQAGYVIVNRKIGLQLNAGVSTDLFINNRKTANGGNLEDINQGRGADSPYRAMNLSGLVGTEFTYRFAERYRIALTPGLRCPMSSIYKTDLGIQSNPLIFDMGLRFRYIFH